MQTYSLFCPILKVVWVYILKHFRFTCRFRVHSLGLFLTLTELYKMTKFASWLVDIFIRIWIKENKIKIFRIVLMQNDDVNYAINKKLIIPFLSKQNIDPSSYLKLFVANYWTILFCAVIWLFISVVSHFVDRERKYHLRLSLIYLDLLQEWSGSTKKNIPLKKEGQREKKSERSTQTESL